MGTNEEGRTVTTVIGLTGPIGCGKTTVAGWLAARGAVVVDADALARRATARGQPALPAIRARFGDAVFDADGNLDRAGLARIVFTDQRALADLEAIVHPAVHRMILSEVEAGQRAGVAFVVLEAIKLVEAGLGALCDEVWIVECGPEAQRARLAGRGVRRDDADRRIHAQGQHLADRLAARLAREQPLLPVRRLRTDVPEEDVRRQVESLAPA